MRLAGLAGKKAKKNRALRPGELNREVSRLGDVGCQRHPGGTKAPHGDFISYSWGKVYLNKIMSDMRFMHIYTNVLKTSFPRWFLAGSP